MSSEGGRGFNVSATPFQPRPRTNSTGSGGDGGKSAPVAAATPEPAQAKKPDTYSDRAKKAVEKEKEAAVKKKQQEQQQQVAAASKETSPNLGPKATAPPSGMKPATGTTPEKGSKEKEKKHVTIKVRYARDKLKDLKASTWKAQLESVQDEERVDHPPFSHIPQSYAKFFDCRAHMDWINWESPLMHVPSSRRSKEKSFQSRAAAATAAAGDPAMFEPGDEAPAMPPAAVESAYQQQQFKTGSVRPRSGSGGSSNRNWGISPGLQALTNSPYSHHTTPDGIHPQYSTFHCTTCASPESSCCETISNLIQSVKRKEKTHDHGFLTQSGDVVIGSVQILLVFEHRATSRRMKLLNERFPKVRNLVKAYLCGEGFHIPPPALSNEDVWSKFLGRLKFDYIRDNRTKVFTELSKHWKRSHTKFEQFAHFASFRDSTPYFPTIGMITSTQKPLLVSCSTGDIESTVLLGELGYQVMADVFWDMLPYYEDLPNHTYAALRHLCVYYFKRQQRRVLMQANQFQVAPSPALPPMRPTAGVSPILGGVSSSSPPPTIPGLGPPPSPSLRPAGVTN